MSLKRILFCDDDPDIREIIELSLGLDPDLELKSCGSAREVLASAAAWGPDLILLDVMMPEMDGPTALAMLNANPCTRSVPVVFMTARTQTYECERFISLGAAGVIAKPFDPMGLAALARGFLSSPRLVPRGYDRLRCLLERDKDRLAQCRDDLLSGADPALVVARARDIAHGVFAATELCGFCGRCGLSELGAAARVLVNTAVPVDSVDIETVVLVLERVLPQDSDAGDPVGDVTPAASAA